MTNPFESLGAQLARLEAKNWKVLQALRTPITAGPVVGGIELAREITRLSKARIYALVSERSLPRSKRGNRLTLNRADLLAWVNDGQRVTTGKEVRRG